MVEYIHRTLQGILQYALPKNSDGINVFYDQPILQWYFGDRSIISEVPSISLQAQSSDPKDIAFGTKVIEHQIVIACWARNDSSENAQMDSVEVTEANIMEFTRLMYAALLPHRRIWVCELCPMDGLFMLSPEHYTIAHNDILSSYVTAVTNTANGIWNETHTSSPPAFLTDGLAADAFLSMYEDVRAGNSVTNLSPSAQEAILAYQADIVSPIRLLYDVVIENIKPAKQENNQALLRGGEFTVHAKELIRQPAYGPGNLPTSAW